MFRISGNYSFKGIRQRKHVPRNSSGSVCATKDFSSPTGECIRKHVPRIFIGLRPQTCLRHAHSPGLHWSTNGHPDCIALYESIMPSSGGRPPLAEPMQPRRPNPSVIPYSGNEVSKGNRQRKHVPRNFSGSVCASLLRKLRF